ncbi:cyclohexanone monooxygenase [Ilyonectria destructans]|nr:cyclohexanone monooxygenase [Ilyonectria destructans]
MGGGKFFDLVHEADFPTRPIDRNRPMKIIVIGAGMSGIIAGIFFPRAIENLELAIYEKNADIGGTWFENVYPGIACDIPSHAYSFTFEGNPEWSSYYASGAEIEGYLRRITNKYDAYKYMKFKHMARKAEWNDEEGKWYVEFENLDTGETVSDTADVLCSAVGILNQWKWPSIPNLLDFKGKLAHSADYDPTYDYAGRRIALIGGGSSGIQILPQIQKKASHVDHYMKGRTWIPPAGIGGEGLIRRGGDPVTPVEDLARFRKNPEEYIAYRRTIENILHRPVEALYQNTQGTEKFMAMCQAHMKAKLAKKPEIYDQLVPSFPPGCRRLTPGPGYLEALVEDNVDFISTGIKKVHPTGIETYDGKFREVDMIICATGFDGVYKQHFPVIGKNSVNLQDVFAELPEAYISMAPRDMPNYYCFLGPNGGPGLGSAVPFLENEAKYMIKVIQKIQQQWIKSMVPKPKLVKAFGQYADRYFKPTVFAAQCNAWWRHKESDTGRLLAIWPGSQLHGSYVFENPRWEDYIYELRPELNDNPLDWFGNGLTQGQIDGDDMTSYLDSSYVPVENPIELKRKKRQQFEEEQEAEISRVKDMRDISETTNGTTGLTKAEVSVNGAQVL